MRLLCPYPHPMTCAHTLTLNHPLLLSYLEGKRCEPWCMKEMCAMCAMMRHPSRSCHVPNTPFGSHSLCVVVSSHVCHVCCCFSADSLVTHFYTNTHTHTHTHTHTRTRTHTHLPHTTNAVGQESLIQTHTQAYRHTQAYKHIPRHTDTYPVSQDALDALHLHHPDFLSFISRVSSLCLRLRPPKIAPRAPSVLLLLLRSHEAHVRWHPASHPCQCEPERAC